MPEQLESSYDCANASNDLHQLNESLRELRSTGELSQEQQQQVNRLENQIHFIKNKCDINNG
ncbi:DUF2524 domain-containing protein [Paenibacillus abyssi]|uniref:DUF2524 domain-containing protein n=2 Tax=Paenibacillus abyssi TaxID=1340531 RepID=A0A917D3I8_9BACL|nr:DUF2524 domain-containing protein [Paenibacillus abyssi]GGG09612.1 hypothetical protein GCM10010916_28100 [Paenibacillus abyssi]